MKIALVRDVKKPNRGTPESAGLDFYIPNDFKTTSKNMKIFLSPGEDILIPSGVVADIPYGYMLMGSDKSGVCTKNKVIVGAKICDSDYQGEIHMHIINVGKGVVTFEPGEKIVQFILVAISLEDVDIVDINDLFDNKTERCTGGFGHTGNK